MRIRTTVTIDSDVLELVKKLAEAEDRSVSRIFERSVKLYINESAEFPPSNGVKVRRGKSRRPAN